MHKKLLIIARDSIPNVLRNTFHPLEGENIHITYTLFNEIRFYLDNESAHITFPQVEDITQFDLVYFRSLKSNRYLYSAILTLYPHLPLLQSITPTNAGSKLIQYCAFAREGLPFPKTLFLHNLFDNNIETTITQYIPYPIVIKDSQGSHGESVYLANNAQELENILTTCRTLKDKHFILQEFIPNTHDYRIVVIEDQAALIVKRTRQEKSPEWRNNTSLGATREILPSATVPKETIDLAIQATKALGYSIAGVDIIINKDTGKASLLELNSAPQLKPGTSEAIANYAKAQLLR